MGLARPALGGGRFRLLRQIGMGGMGVVYEAYDSLRNETVALKTLQDSESLYRFKREFRSLADVSHPNLVTLYELFASEEEWYFTMELVRGLPFVSWIRPRGSGEENVPPTGAWYSRLRGALAQLAHALVVLHEGGWLHGDVKPSNILVTDEGRVVVLDFGLITELRPRFEDEEPDLAGTPNYMAPEQVRREPPTAASDWYAFGVILFESLTGRRLIEGSAVTVLTAKAFESAAPALDQLPRDAPEDLAALCVDLLRAGPADRPLGPEVLERLGASRPPAEDERPGDDPELVGRGSALAVLRSALAEVDEGRGGRSVLVYAASGMGKTALVDAFLRSTEERADVVVLRGRCYEREDVPYKALDSVVDTLCRWLREQPVSFLEEILPEDTVALATAFPVLQRLEIIASRAAIAPGQQAKLGKRALAALTSLLAKIAARWRLILFIDDLQWGDLDSAALLGTFLTPDGPPLLFLGSFRSEHRSESHVLVALLEAARVAPGALVELSLAPLSAAELEALAAHHLRRSGAPDDLAAHIGRQANGSPYFAQELARHAASSLRRGDANAEGMSLHGVVLARASRLSGEARMLLDVIAVAGAPLARQVIERAFGVGGANKQFVELAMGHFTRTSVIPEDDTIVTAHDAIREAVTGALSAERLRALHYAIGAALETAGGAEGDAHWLAHHFFHAWPDVPGERVFELCRDAATEAARSHAYDQAHVHLERAQRVARDSKIELDVGFDQLLGEVAARRGHMGAAADALRRALPKATSARVRAELHLALARIAAGRLDTSGSEIEIRRGLTELGYEAPRRTFRSAAVSLATLLRGQWLQRVRPSRIGRLTSDEHARARVALALLTQGAHTAYFKMDRLTFVQGPLRQYPIALSIGDSAELAECYAASAMVATVAGRTKLGERLAQSALKLTEKLRDPVATARVNEYYGHVLHYRGETQRAERVMVECLSEMGQWLENGDYLTTVADLAWNALMRGKAELGWRWVLRGIERAAVDGAESRFTKGHTYLCYGGPLLARLGRVEEGRRRLEEFRTLLDNDSSGSGERRDDSWRRRQWLAHWLLFHVLIGDVGTTFDAAVDEFHAMGSARKLPLQLRHFNVAHAWGRLLQLDRAKGAERSSARARWQAARNELAKAAAHPTLRAHLAVLDAKYHLMEGDRSRARERLSEAESLARAHDNSWVLGEAATLASSRS